MKKLLLSLCALVSLTAFAGTGTATDPYTVADVIAKGADASETGVNVHGYIVGYVNGKSLDETSSFFDLSAGVDAISATNILLADDATCKDYTKCIPVQLPSGNVRTNLNLKDNAANLGKGITLTGDIAKYFLVAGFKNTSAYLFDGGNPEVVVSEVGSIAEFLAKADTKNPVKFTCELTAVYQQYSRLYVTDGKDFMLVYGSVNQTYNNGDKIAAGVTGTYALYNNQIQLGSPDKTTFSAGVAGTPVEPEIYQVEELSFDLLSRYIKILGVSVAIDATVTSGKQYTLTDNTGTAVLYNQFGVNITDGTGYDFVGFVGCYKDALQVQPIQDLGTGTTPPDTPEPPQEDNANVAYFVAPTVTDVTGCKLLNNDGSTKAGDGKSEAQSLIGTTFTEKGVSLVFNHGTGEYFTSSFDNHVRWYASGEVATLTPAAGVSITKVYFKTVANSKGNFTASTGTVEGTGVGADNPITWTGSASEPLVFTTVKQVRFAYMEVTTEGFSGIEDVVVNDANAPVKYFNLQGVEVANPENGVFIRVQGNKASKVLVK